ncbi:hypothetical protein [Actinoplanes sp. HUAS TT8]|uniref:hypothetical protein n=1 Tax=Actinoplanes sp. HUAS TT8 TaxID=3447453 RepID=UPI003F523F26
MEKRLSDRQVRAVAAADDVRHSYFVFADGRLWRTGAGTEQAEVVAEMPNVREAGEGTGDGRIEDRELEIRLYVHGPWVCVTERFGVNAALVDTTTGAVRELRREDYHSDVSSYSIGFLERDGQTLLLAQTAWNRLDVFDAWTGANLTEREVFNRDTGRSDERGFRVFESQNYIDYFHSLLHVSPDSRRFLSNGWAWSPVDFVNVFSTEAFLSGYEETGVSVSTAFGYNWDRPCAFIGDRTFVLALDEQGDGTDPYRQLAFFDIPETPSDELLEPNSLVDCEVFPRNQDGEVKGELHYDAESGCLVALTSDNGSSLVSLTGEIVSRMPDLNLASPPAHGDFGSSYSGSGGWSYAPKHRLFYRWVTGVGIEERLLPATV